MVDFVIGNDKFGESLANFLKCDYRKFEEGFYPDSEYCPFVDAGYEELEGKEVVLAPRAGVYLKSENLALTIQNFQRIANALSDEKIFNVKSVDFVFPYFWFARQDHNPRYDQDEKVKKRDEGKDIGFKYITRSFKGLGVRKILSVNPHFHRSPGSFMVDDMEIISISGMPALARYLKTQPYYNPNTLVIGPDLNANVLSEELAKELGLKSTNLSKERIDSSKVFFGGLYDVKGSDVIISDDIISTGNTIAQGIKVLENAKNVVVASVHPVLTPSGEKILNELQSSGKVKDVVASDTLPSKFSKTSVVSEVAACLSNS